jgi:hypothetical protein
LPCNRRRTGYDDDAVGERGSASRRRQYRRGWPRAQRG